mmetsp:Transcript_2215/g.3286  ORF Transcript_2215/g.3286 Transcript_2215/m.3286 type:complete len:305 (-) Transcript_2215:361-1275(-)
MTAPFDILIACAGITAAIQLSGFSVAYYLQTETFYDILGGINFLALGAYTYASGGDVDASSPRKLANLVVFSCSRLWLLLFLAWRAHERGGDARFDEVKDKFGWFLVFWIVQGIWVFCISMPTLLVLSSIESESSFSTLDIISLSAFASAVIFEIVADVQKAIWVKQGRPGNFCQVGVWKYSRHPNYFGEILQWWSSWAFCYGSVSDLNDTTSIVLWLLSSVSPLFTMHILLNTPATGIMNANGKNLKRYYDACPVEYSRYRERTSILVPMVGYQHVPLVLKRTIFFDLKCYEYKPTRNHSKIQ